MITERYTDLFPQGMNVNNPVQAKRSSGQKDITSFPQLRQELNSSGVQEKKERLHTPSYASLARGYSCSSPFGLETPPCQFTVEELRAEVTKSLNDFENGNYITIEKMREKHPRL